MIALGAVASAFGAVVFMVLPFFYNPNLVFIFLQVQPFLIGDIVTTVSKGRDQSSVVPTASDAQARNALNSFAGILLRYIRHLELQPRIIFHSLTISLFVCDALFFSLQTMLFGIAGSRMAARLRTQVFPLFFIQQSHSHSKLLSLRCLAH
jgi:hypothetical protein